MKRHLEYVKNEPNPTNGLPSLFNSHYHIKNFTGLPKRNALFNKYHKEMMSFAAYGICISDILDFCKKLDPKFFGVTYGSLSANIRACCYYYSQNNINDLNLLIGDFVTYVDNFIDNYVSSKTKFPTKEEIYSIVSTINNMCNDKNNNFSDLDYIEITNKRKETETNLNQALNEQNYDKAEFYMEELKKLKSLENDYNNPDAKAYRDLCKYVFPGVRSYLANNSKH